MGGSVEKQWGMAGPSLGQQGDAVSGRALLLHTRKDTQKAGAKYQ
ncbi:MAG: hypothetical protein QTN59_15905 [Candidatus Electrothrix communis]|nr:MAG: hypothetical protein QTN59_15905 [Candidatus Electrothrix communis]